MAAGTWSACAALVAGAGSASAQCFNWVSCRPNAPVVAFGGWDPDGPGPAGTRLVAAGWFSRLDGVPARHVGEQDPATGAWSDIAGGVWDTAQPNGRVVVGLPNGELVVGGRFNMAGESTVALKIARFDGVQWRSLGEGLSLENSDGARPTSAVVLPNGDLVVGGTFARSGAVALNNVGRWDGTSWHAMGAGLDRLVTALLVLPDGRVCAGGEFLNSGAVPLSRVAVWDGQAWSSVGDGTSDTVNSLCWYGGRLTAGGRFRAAGEAAVGGLAQWDGARWTALTDGVPEFRTIRALAVLPTGELVAGGDFTSVGGVNTGGLAVYDGVGWATLDERLEGSVDSLYVAPDGRMAVGGSMTNSRSGKTGGFIRTPGEAPAPQSGPFRVRMCASQTISIGAGMSGGRPMTFQWRRGGVPISDVPGSLSGVNSEMLTFVSPTPDLVGEYDCLVTNGCGSSLSTQIRVDVCLADMDCNQFVDFFDYDGFLNAFQRGGAAADVNADGIIDFFDYVAFVDAFEAGC